MADEGGRAILSRSMSLPDLLPVQPFTRPARGVVHVPGSKSLTNRALLLAALSDQPLTLTGALFSEDTHLMVAALRRLGFSVTADHQAFTIRVEHQGTAFPDAGAQLFVGLAGTAARFLTALCAAAPRGSYRLDGVPQMRRRPMQPLIGALRSLGADIRCLGEEGHFPLEIRARGLRGGTVSLDASDSSQLLSALLMVAPLCHADLVIELTGPVRRPFVDMTSRLMERFGRPAVAWTGEGRLSAAAGGRYVPPADHYAIERDATAASYFLALPLVTTGEVRVPGLGTGAEQGLQGDIRFASVLARAGMTVNAKPAATVAAFPGGRGTGVVQDFTDFSDTFLTLAAIAPLLAGPTRITGIAHTRKQETDRVAGMARELTKLGQHVIETGDSLEIHPQPIEGGVTIDTHGDHRFAMSFAILGCHDLHGDGRPWLTIRNPACCAKTFPRFFEVLESLRHYAPPP